MPRLTPPFEQLRVPPRPAVKGNEEEWTVSLDLSVFASEPDEEDIITFSVADDGRIQADSTEKIKAEARSVIKGLWSDNFQLSTEESLRELVTFQTGLSGRFHSASFAPDAIKKMLFARRPDESSYRHEYPYDHATAAICNQLGSALRTLFAPPEENSGMWFWEKVYELNSPNFFNVAQTLPELPQLCETNKSWRSLIRSVMLGDNSPMTKMQVNTKDDLFYICTGGHMRWSYVQPESLSSSQLKVVRQAFEEDLFPRVSHNDYRHFAVDWAESLAPNLPDRSIVELTELVRATEDDDKTRSALKAGLARLSRKNKGSYERGGRELTFLSYLAGEEDFRRMIRAASASSGLEPIQFLDEDANFFSSNTACALGFKDGTEEPIPYSAWLADAKAACALEDKDPDAINLAKTEYSEDVPDSEEVNVSIIGDIEGFKESLADTGALLLTHYGHWSKSKLEGTRYIFEVKDQKANTGVGYLFMTDYFKTNYSWKVNKEKFDDWYGKIRYRVSVIRKNCRVIEELDVF